MIQTPAPRNSRTNRFQAIIESEPTNSAAPTPARRFPVAIALASITPITTMYPTTGTTSAGSVRRTPGTIVRASSRNRERDDHGDREELDRGRTVGPEARRVAEMPDEESEEPADELLAREHEQHVAEQREHERGHEPAAASVGTRSRVERHGRDDQCGQGRRLAHVLDPLPRRRRAAPGDRQPVAHREHGGHCEHDGRL